jgi:hypothetical protein
MSERDGYGPVVPCWVAATPPDPGFGASTVNQPRGGFAGGVTWPPSRLLGGT